MVWIFAMGSFHGEIMDHFIYLIRTFSLSNYWLPDYFIFKNFTQSETLKSSNFYISWFYINFR